MSNPNSLMQCCHPSHVKVTPQKTGLESMKGDFWEKNWNKFTYVNCEWCVIGNVNFYAQVMPDGICITAVLLEYTTRIGKLTKGVATSWLKQKIPTDGIKPRVPIYVRKSQFSLPFKPSTPIIMIGPGTGLAPFRGFIQERDSQRQEG